MFTMVLIGCLVNSDILERLPPGAHVTVDL